MACMWYPSADSNSTYDQFISALCDLKLTNQLRRSSVTFPTMSTPPMVSIDPIATAPSLPLELLKTVIECPGKDLKSVRLVSHTLKDFAVPILFSHTY